MCLVYGMVKTAPVFEWTTQKSVFESKRKLDMHTHKCHTGSTSGDFFDDKIIINNYMMKNRANKRDRKWDREYYGEYIDIEMHVQHIQIWNVKLFKAMRMHLTARLKYTQRMALAIFDLMCHLPGKYILPWLHCFLFDCLFGYVIFERILLYGLWLWLYFIIFPNRKRLLFVPNCRCAVPDADACALCTLIFILLHTFHRQSLLLWFDGKRKAKYV